jgi:hypothetical protein
MSNPPTLYKHGNNKIDLSNEDHCGPCGQYAKGKIDLQDKITVYVDNKKDVNPK